jgi:LuxR family maltose regulon positive regulatory protein
LVERHHLYERLNTGLKLSLALVTAPAGYGKTTLLAAWMRHCPLPISWLSLDEDNNDLSSFATYLIAAIRTVFPMACPRSAALAVAQIPSVATFATVLASELDLLPARMALILDDIHEINDQAVLALLAQLVRHPLSGVHLVLAGRKDPFLPVARLRARGQLTDLRVSDLRFSRTETIDYLQQSVSVALPPAAIDILEEETEGWISGLHLAALSISTTLDSEVLLRKLRFGCRYIIDYLGEEVVGGLEPANRDLLLLASLPDRFCVSLCDVLVGSGASAPSGEDFLAWLERANLFVSPLDEAGEWYRFHPLFRRLLRRLLNSRFGTQEIAACHLRISAWLAQQGLLADALHHALEAGDEEAAVQLVELHLPEVLNREDRLTLDRWLRRLPERLVLRHPALLMVKAISLELLGRTAAIHPVLERIEELVASGRVPLSAHIQQYLCGASELLKSLGAYARGELAGCLEHAWAAIQVAPANDCFVRGNATFVSALAKQCMGHGEHALEELKLALATSADPVDGFASQVRLALAFLHAFAGNTALVTEVTETIVTSGAVSGNWISVGWAHYLMGASAYERNDLDAAMHHFTAVSRLRYQVHTRANHFALLGQAAVCLARGALDEAGDLVKMALELADETGSPDLIAASRALSARLALAHGEPNGAEQHLPTAISHNDALPCMGMASTLTHAEFLLVRRTESSLHEAATVLEAYLTWAEDAHNIPQIVYTLVLQAVVLKALGRSKAALECLRRALEIAEPSGFVRVFLGVGKDLADLLRDLARRGVAPGFITQLLADACKSRSEPAGAPKPIHQPQSLELVETLTFREQEVLQLLAQRLSNKEIAEQLIITTGTVRSHTANIYQKLQVASRRQAVLKAQALAIL